MPAEEFYRLHAIITGRVQGVGYRYFAVRQAQEYQLTGWVRNCKSGAVEVEAEGNQENLQSFLIALQAGPKSSFVEKITQEWTSINKKGTSFRIRPTE